MYFSYLLVCCVSTHIVLSSYSFFLFPSIMYMTGYTFCNMNAHQMSPKSIFHYRNQLSQRNDNEWWRWVIEWVVHESILPWHVQLSTLIFLFHIEMLNLITLHSFGIDLTSNGNKYLRKFYSREIYHTRIIQKWLVNTYLHGKETFMLSWFGGGVWMANFPKLN